MTGVFHKFVPGPDPHFCAFEWGEGLYRQVCKYPEPASIHTSSVPQPEQVDHPAHYGGADDKFEHIKVAEAKNWGYHIGNCTKYLWRAGEKTPDPLQDLLKAKWYLDRYINKIRREKGATDTE